jgi:hypothetical protein
VYYMSRRVHGMTQSKRERKWRESPAKPQLQVKIGRSRPHTFACGEIAKSHHNNIVHMIVTTSGAKIEFCKILAKRRSKI